MKKLGGELLVGDIVIDPYGCHRILSLHRYTIPAKVFISSVAERYPDGMPAVGAEVMNADGCKVERTFFLDEHYEVAT